MIVITVSAECDITTISEDAPGALAREFQKTASNMFGGKPVKVGVSVKVTNDEPIVKPVESEPEPAPKRSRMRRKSNG